MYIICVVDSYEKVCMDFFVVVEIRYHYVPLAGQDLTK